MQQVRPAIKVCAVVVSVRIYTCYEVSGFVELNPSTKPHPRMITPAPKKLNRCERLLEEQDADQDGDHGHGEFDADGRGGAEAQIAGLTQDA